MRLLCGQDDTDGVASSFVAHSLEMAMSVFLLIEILVKLFASAALHVVYLMPIPTK